MLFIESLSIVQRLRSRRFVRGCAFFGDGAKLVAGMKANPWGIKMLFLSRCCLKKEGGIVGLSPCRETCSNSSFLLIVYRSW